MYLYEMNRAFRGILLNSKNVDIYILPKVYNSLKDL